MECRICNNSSGNRSYLIKEMMFGSGQEFKYFQCEHCGCLQIAELPENMAQYYPADYFSFSAVNDGKGISSIRGFIDSHRLRHLLGFGDRIGQMFSFFARPIAYASWLKNAGLDVGAKVLDVGCGHGKLLRKMALGGMTRLVGVDPYIRESIVYADGVKVYKNELGDCPKAWNGSFDMVMFHHSFEHIEIPTESLVAAKRLLADKGVILIRIPVADSYAWREYQENWFQIDAPRHIFLHTLKSMQLLCNPLGLQIFHTESVGEVGQFTCSELYRQGISLNRAKRKNANFSRKEVSRYRKLTRTLNLQGEGDQTIFFIRRNS